MRFFSFVWGFTICHAQDFMTSNRPWQLQKMASNQGVSWQHGKYLVISPEYTFYIYSCLSEKLMVKLMEHEMDKFMKIFFNIGGKHVCLKIFSWIYLFYSPLIWWLHFSDQLVSTLILVDILGPTVSNRIMHPHILMQ